MGPSLWWWSAAVLGALALHPLLGAAPRWAPAAGRRGGLPQAAGDRRLLAAAGALLVVPLAGGAWWLLLALACIPAAWWVRRRSGGGRRRLAVERGAAPLARALADAVRGGRSMRGRGGGRR